MDSLRERNIYGLHWYAFRKKIEAPVRINWNKFLQNPNTELLIIVFFNGWEHGFSLDLIDRFLEDGIEVSLYTYFSCLPRNTISWKVRYLIGWFALAIAVLIAVQALNYSTSKYHFYCNHFLVEVNNQTTNDSRQ